MPKGTKSKREMKLKKSLMTKMATTKAVQKPMSRGISVSALAKSCGFLYMS